jgi:hypothetical protein
MLLDDWRHSDGSAPHGFNVLVPKAGLKLKARGELGPRKIDTRERGRRKTPNPATQNP